MKKTIIFLASLFLAIQFVKGQNICTESIERYDYTNDTFIFVPITVNLTALRENNQINISAVTNLIKFKDKNMVINITNNQRAAWSIFASAGFCNWGSTAVANLYKGAYAASGLNTNQIGFFDIYHCNSQLSRDRLIIHARHELEARTDAMMDGLLDSLCIGIRSMDNQIVIGKLITHNQTLSKAYLEQINGLVAWIVDWYSVAKATTNEILKYY